MDRVCRAVTALWEAGRTGVPYTPIRRGRPLDQRLELGRGIVDICAEVLGVPKRTVLVEFTIRAGDEMLRDGYWAGEWPDAEAPAGMKFPPKTSPV
jgi:hypothetical protein